MANDKMTMGERIERVLMAHGVSRKDFCDRTNIFKQSLSQYINGETEPSPENMRRILAEFPGLTRDYLYDGKRAGLDERMISLLWPEK